MNARTNRFIATATACNTKRAKRRTEKAVSSLAADLTKTRHELRAMSNKVLTAREDGANALLRTEYLSDFVSDLKEHLIAQYGQELAAHAKQLERSDRYRRPISLTARFVEYPKPAIRITGSIPELRYTVEVR